MPERDNTTQDRQARVQAEQSKLNDFLILKALELNVRAGGIATGWIGALAGGALGMYVSPLAVAVHSLSRNSTVSSSEDVLLRPTLFLGKYAGLLTAVPGAVFGLLFSPARMIQILKTRTLFYTSDQVNLFIQGLNGLLPIFNSTDNVDVAQELSLLEKYMKPLVFSLLIHDIIKDYGAPQFSTSSSSGSLQYALSKLYHCRENWSETVTKLICYLSETETPLSFLNSTAHSKNQGKRLFNIIMAKLETYKHFLFEENDRRLEFSTDYLRKILSDDDLFKYVFSKMPGILIMMVSALLPEHSEQVQEMIRQNDYHALSWSAENNYFNICEKIMELAPDDVQAMIQANVYAVFRQATYNRNTRFTNRLLEFPSVFAYAEIHEYEYRESVQPFILEKLESIRAEKRTLESANPLAVFDITNPEKAQLYFLIILNLIRHNNPALLDDMRYLLGIPAINALAHQEVLDMRSNHLFRLALRIGNTAAAEILLNIPAVRALAVANDYYRQEVSGAIDLTALAGDRESSMHALSTGEQKRLESVIALYKPVMQRKGVEPLFFALKKQLVDRYMANPAQITTNGAKLSLPLNWQEFNKLTLTSAQREEALKAYYQNANHTAWRYLSKPNYWMDNNASYVVVDSSGRYSTFEEYKTLIVMLWCAAIDENTPATDGHTLAGRLDHFINELTHIGRAHNWDNIRPKMVAKIGPNKKPLLDDKGRVVKIPLLNCLGGIVTEEHDNFLEGDKPSCYSGVKRRLFQSVVGHPLLKMLTLDDIKQELRDFVRQHFATQINDVNKGELVTAWNAYLASGELDDAKPLRLLDITPNQQKEFLQYLTKKYDFQFTDEPRFQKYIQTEFALIENDARPSDCMHALKFDGLIQLDSLLRNSSISPAM